MITMRARCGRGAGPGGHSASPGASPRTPRPGTPRWPAGPVTSSRGLGPAGSRLPGSVSLVRTLHVLQEPGEVLAGQALRCAFEALHRPGPEVEVERACRVLDRSPQRPAVLAHHPEQPGPGDLVPQRRPV